MQVKILLKAATLTCLSFFLFSVQTVKANQETCPEGNGWVKVDDLSDYTYTYTPEPGYTVTNNCYKHSTYVHFGTGATVTADTHYECKWKGLVPDCDWKRHELSHASFKVVQTDVCLNIDGNQTSVPNNYYNDESNNCYPKTPVCADPEALNGETVDEDEYTDNTLCEYPPTDICADINGTQTEVPAGHYQDGENCPEQTPVCTDDLANNYDEDVTSDEISDNEVCTYDERPYCVDDETIYVPVNKEAPEGAEAGECSEEPTDVCPNIDDVQETVPEGMELKDGICVEIPDEEEPEPTPTPTPAPGKTSGLEITALSCTNRNFDVIIDLKDNNTAAAGVKVKFTYNNKTVEATTDAQGKARAGFRYEGDMSVKVEPENDFPGHNRHVELPKDLVCDEAGVGGTGEVLGATTMAETGVLEDLFFQALGSVGGMLTMVGSTLYAKKKRA